MPAAALGSTLWVLEQYGLVAPSTLTSPVRMGLGKFGDGLFVEEGTTNLVTNPSFETGTTGWGTNSAGATIGTSTTRAFLGSQSLAVTGTGTSAASTGASYGFSVTSGTTYTAQAKVFVPSPVSDGVVLLAIGAGVNVATSPISTYGKWVPLTVTFTPTSTTTMNLDILTGPASFAATGVLFYIDAVQIETKGYATSYCDGSLGAGHAWTGTANASTSTRAAGRVTATLPSALVGPLTVCGWFRAGRPGSTGTRIVAGLPAGGTTPNLYYDGSTLTFSSNVDVSAVTSMIVAAGDLVFAAGTLAADGKTYGVYGAKNGGTAVSATSSASGTAYSGAATVGIGDLAGGTGASQIDGVIDQFLVFNRVLTTTELNTLAAATSETTFADDPGIVLAVATGVARGIYNRGTNQSNDQKVATTAGSGFYRPLRSVGCSMEPIIFNGLTANPDDDTSNYKISVPAGSGIGQGALVTPNSPLGGNVYTVKRVFSPGGDFDELYVA